MIEYIFRRPTYRPFPYELTLAEEELVALTGGSPERVGQDLAVRVKSALPLVTLQRLAFSSRVEGPRQNVLTHAHLLEQSALRVRNGDGGIRSNRESLRKESTYLTHGLHRYKGKFYPQLCRALVNIAGVEPGGLVLDPFAGSGTTLVECAVSGLDVIGTDLNPLAHLIASTKLALIRTPVGRLARCASQFEAALRVSCSRHGMRWRRLGAPEPEASGDDDGMALARRCGLPESAEELRRWFPPAVRHKLVAVLDALDCVQDPVFSQFVRVCLSDQIRSVSQQDSRDLRIRRRSEPIEDAPLITLLTEKLHKELEKLAAGLDVLGGPVKPKVARAELLDARLLHRGHAIFFGRRVDAVVSSPPYANALPYIDTDRLSLLVLGMLSASERNKLQRRIIGNREIHEGHRRALEEEMLGPTGLRTLPSTVANQIRKIMTENGRYVVGFRRRNVPALLFQYFRDMRLVMRRLHEAVRHHGRALLVLGDSTTELGDGHVFPIQTTRHIVAISEAIGWSMEGEVAITVTTEDLAHAKNAITANSVIVLRRGRARPTK